VWIVFGGLYTNEENVPRPLRFLPRCSLIKQAFEGLCVNELRGMDLVVEKPGKKNLI
jgi:hypothetical protein